MLPFITLLLQIATPAEAAWPEDVTLSAMAEYKGVATIAPLTDDYRDLIGELGTAVANKPIAAPRTLGAYGFDVSMDNSFAFTKAKGDDANPSPWQRAHADNDPMPFIFAPSLTVRKGLPLSFEVGASMSWLGGSRQGSFSGFVRAAIVEGYKPFPDVTVQVGYSGYVGNDELELGVMDLGISVGSSYAYGASPGMRHGLFMPYANFTLLRVSAHPILDDATTSTIGAVRYTSKDGEGPILLPRAGVGIMVTSNNVAFRVAIAWAPATIATLTTGMGFSF